MRDSKLKCTGQNIHGQTDIPNVYNLHHRQNFIKVFDNDIYAGGYSSCVTQYVLVDSPIETQLFSNLICFGEIDSIQKVPQSFFNKYQECYNKEYITDFQQDQKSNSKQNISIGESTICGYYHHDFNEDVLLQEETDYLKQIFLCWGKCSDNLCDTQPITELLTNSNLESINVGVNHACIIQDHFNSKPEPHTPSNSAKIRNMLHCWGSNAHGQLLTPADFNQGHIVSAQAGNNTTCALKINNQFECWGMQTQTHPQYLQHNQYQYRSIASTPSSSEADSVENSNLNYQTRTISSGGRNTCAIIHHTLHCVGNNDYGQTDVPLNTSSSALAVDSGWDQSCASLVDGPVSCWGLNLLGQTDVPEGVKGGLGGGLGYAMQRGKESWMEDKLMNAISVQQKERVVVRTGLSHSCSFVDKMDRVEWHAEVERDAEADADAEAEAEAEAEAGSDSEADNQLVCWGGNNEQGELEAPAEFATNVAVVSIGDEHTCVIRQSNETIANPENETASGFTPQDINDANAATSTSNQPPLTPVPLDQQPPSNNPNPQHSLALLCWGSNSSAQLDIPPLDPESHFQFSSVSSGGAHNCAQFKPHYQQQQTNTNHHARDVLCWGSDSQGQTSLPAHLQVGTLQVSLGTQHSCVISIRSHVWCWGGVQRDRSVDRVPGVKNVAIGQVAAGQEHDCWIDKLGVGQCQGSDDQEQCQLFATNRE